MHNVVIDKPYVFVPPHRGRFWAGFLQRFARRRLKRKFGVVQVECRGMEVFQQSLSAGHGVLLAPNHCRPADPFVVSEFLRRAGTVSYTMASWHIFMQGRFQSWMLTHGGVFSVYREGMDRAALNMAIEILEKAERPLVIFPEGVISRSNERLNALMEGTAFIARSAAKKRAKTEPPGQVVIHPLALKYFYRGDIEKALTPVLAEIENRLSWRPQHALPLVERIHKIGRGLLCLKEIELLGQTQTGELHERLQRLIDHLLSPLEKKWVSGRTDTNVISRVKKLRTAILPDMVQKDLPADERESRWRQLADMYLAQQIACYPPDYLTSSPSPERLLETVERFQEDLTDACNLYPPMTVTVQVGTPIPVSAARDRSGGDDPVMAELEQQLNQMIAGIQR